MARTDNLTNYLTDVATAIKTKKGDNTPILASNFDTEITNLPGGGTDIRWEEIGYEEEPEFIQKGIDYAEEIYNNWDESITSMNKAYYNDRKLKFFPNVNTSNVTDCYQAFYMCSNLNSIGDDFDFSNAQSCYQMFYGSSVNKINNLNLPLGASCKEMFKQSNIETINTLNICSTSDGQNNMFNNAPLLKEIKNINVLVNKTTSIIFWVNNTNLTNDTLKVILGALKKLTSQTSSYKNLKAIGLSQAQATTCTTFEEWDELQTNGWTTGY